MTRHRSTSLKYFVKHCPAALGFYEADEPMDRDIFQPGIAAHAVLQELTEAANRQIDVQDAGKARRIGEAVARTLMTEGRSFDGVPEPPMSPDAAVEGRDIALEWAAWNPIGPGSQAEVGLAIDAKGNACAYDDPAARYVAILDDLRLQEVGDEEYSGRAAVLTDYKSSWPTDATELDTVQMRGQAVLVDAKHGGEIDIITRRVANLRTRQTFEHTLSPEEDRAMLEQWKRDILALCDAADETRDARPGAGCAGCPWAHSCPDAWSAVKDAQGVASQFAAAQAIRDDLFDLAKLVCKEQPQQVADGLVGYHAKPARYVPVEAYRTLALHWFGVVPEDAEAWAAEHSSMLGLLAALKLGVTQVEAAAKSLYPGRDGKLPREELLEMLTAPSVRRQFGVERIDRSAQAAAGREAA